MNMELHSVHTVFAAFPDYGGGEKVEEYSLFIISGSTLREHPVFRDRCSLFLFARCQCG